MPNIWVAKNTGHDLSGAAEKGTVQFVFPDSFSPFKMRDAREIIANAFKKTPPKPEDFILFLGPTSLNVQLAVALIQQVGDGIRCLIYHTRDRVYVVRDISEPWGAGAPAEAIEPQR